MAMTKKNVGALVPSILGMGANIAGAIPGLKKPRRVDSAKAVADTAPRVMGAAVGAAQAGQGASRGLALREGLRQAAFAGEKIAGQVGQAAQQDAVINQANTDARNARIKDFVNSTTEGLGQFTQAMIQPEKKDLAQEQAQAAAAIQMQPEMQQDPTGLAGGGAVGDPSPGPLDTPQAEQAGITDQGPDLAQMEADLVAGPVAKFQSTDALNQLRAMSPTIAAPEIEADLENRLQAKRLMLQDAERLGISLDNVWANINRQLNLKPGQSGENPLGVRIPFSSGGEE